MNFKKITNIFIKIKSHFNIDIICTIFIECLKGLCGIQRGKLVKMIKLNKKIMEIIQFFYNKIKIILSLNNNLKTNNNLKSFIKKPYYK